MEFVPDALSCDSLPSELILEVASYGSFLWFARFAVLSRSYHNALERAYWWKEWIRKHNSEREILWTERTLELLAYRRPHLFLDCNAVSRRPLSPQRAYSILSQCEEIGGRLISQMDRKGEMEIAVTAQYLNRLYDAILRQPKTHPIFSSPYELLRKTNRAELFARLCVGAPFDLIDRLVVAINRQIDQSYHNLALWKDPRKEDDPTDGSQEGDFYYPIMEGEGYICNLAVAAMKVRRFDVLNRVFEQCERECPKYEFENLMRSAERYLSYEESFAHLYPHLRRRGWFLVLWEDVSVRRYFWAQISTCRIEDHQTPKEDNCYWEVDWALMNRIYQYYSPCEALYLLDTWWSHYPIKRKG